MTCIACRDRPGWSGYAQRTEDGWTNLPCRCVTDADDRDLYGHSRNRLAMLREIARAAA